MDRNPVNELMQKGLRERVFPGAVLLVGKGDRPLLFEAYGQANLFTRQPMTRHTVFDLASLTKPLATTLAVARLVDQGLLHLELPVGTWLPDLNDSEKARITVRQLLCHQGGLPAHRPFYMTLKSLAPKVRKAALLGLLEQVPLEYRPGEATLYSDLGFMLLGRLVEKASNRSLDRFLREAVYGPMEIPDLFFVNLACIRRPYRPYAATELCPVRNRLLTGEVHDDNAWFAGGVDGHAGLFGTAGAVFNLLRRLVAEFRGRAAGSIYSRPILKEVFYGTDSAPAPMGFDRPSLSNSSAGSHFSADTVGHLGFTGVSFWLDLDKDACVILLTNRVHPTRWSTGLAGFRPLIHDRVMEHFEI